MKICPKCGGDLFIVSQHITETILVDGNGEYISQVSSCDEITHRADDDDIWTCDRCGFDATGSEFNVPDADDKGERLC